MQRSVAAEAVARRDEASGASEPTALPPPLVMSSHGPSEDVMEGGALRVRSVLLGGSCPS